MSGHRYVMSDVPLLLGIGETRPQLDARSINLTASGDIETLVRVDIDDSVTGGEQPFLVIATVTGIEIHPGTVAGTPAIVV